MRGSATHELIATSNASRWVSSYLRAYCGPGRHEFRAADAAIEWCTVCYKEQARDGSCCLVCDQPGESAVELRAPRATGPVRGRLCAECLRGLQEIPGWAIAPAS